MYLLYFYLHYELSGDKYNNDKVNNIEHNVLLFVFIIINTCEDNMNYVKYLYIYIYIFFVFFYNIKNYQRHSIYFFMF